MTVSFHAIIALVLLRAWTVQSHQLTAQQTEVYSKEGWKSVKESAWEICFVHGLMMMGVLAFICLTQRYPRTARNSLFYFAAHRNPAKESSRIVNSHAFRRSIACRWFVRDKSIYLLVVNTVNVIAISVSSISTISPSISTSVFGRIYPVLGASIPTGDRSRSGYFSVVLLGVSGSRQPFIATIPTIWGFPNAVVGWADSGRYRTWCKLPRTFTERAVVDCSRDRPTPYDRHHRASNNAHNNRQQQQSADRNGLEVAANRILEP